MDENNNENINENIQAEEPQANNNPNFRIPKTGSNKKKGKKGLLRKGINGFLKSAIKVVTNPIFLKIAIPIILIVILACAVLAFLDEVVQTFNIDVNNSVKNIQNTDYYNGLSEEGKSEVNAAIDIFNKKGTTLALPVSTIEHIIDENSNLENKGSFTDIDENLYDSLSTEFGESGKDSNGFQTLESKASLYSHILYTDKYNFNNIKWRSYGHGYSDQEITTFNYDTDKNLKIPVDQGNTSLDTFINLTSPYLLNYRIPSTFLTAMSLMNCSEDIGYQVIKHCESDITVNRYDMTTLSVDTKYDEYDRYTGYSRAVITVDSKGNMSLNSVSFIEDTSNLTHVNERLDDSGKIDRTKETQVNSTSNTTYSYYIKEAKTFDIYRICDYNYMPYSESDVNSVTNYDSEAEVDVQEFKRYSDESLIYNSSNFSLSNCKNINDVKSTYNLSQQGDTVKNNDGSTTYYLVTPNITIEDGDTHFINRVWSDKLSQTKSENKNYTIDDLINFNKNEENDSEKSTVSEDELKSDTDSYDEYVSIAEDGDMNLFIMMNSNPKIYQEYSTGRHKYMGMDVSLLYTTYRQLSTIFTELKDTNGVVPFIYGHSFDLNNTFQGDVLSSNTLGGFTWPVPTYVEQGLNMEQQITSWFGWRGAIAGTSHAGANFHTGLDISAGGSPPIVAARDGVIIRNTNDGDVYGNYIVIKHDNGYYTLYGHMSTTDASLVAGTQVKAGQQIGIMGTTGNSSGVHLHFEIIEATEDSQIWSRENKRDPKEFFNEDCSGKGIGGSLAGIEIGTALSSQKYIKAAEYLEYAKKWGEKYGLDPYLIIAIIAQESSGIPDNSAGSIGGQGLMQIEKGAYLNKTITCEYLDGSTEQVVASMQNLDNPDINIQIGCHLLRSHIDNYNGNLLAALQGYNYGPGGIRRCISYYLSEGKNTDQMYCGISQEEYVNYLATNDTGWLGAREWYSSGGCTAFGPISSYAGDPNYLSNIFRFYNTEAGMPYFITKDGNKIQFSAN